MTDFYVASVAALTRTPSRAEKIYPSGRKADHHSLCKGYNYPNALAINAQFPLN
jgi:hypothetical protein